MPPFVILQRKSMNAALIKGKILGTLNGCSEKGWMPQSLFKQWFETHFLHYIPAPRPVLLQMATHHIIVQK